MALQPLPPLADPNDWLYSQAPSIAAALVDNLPQPPPNALLSQLAWQIVSPTSPGRLCLASHAVEDIHFAPAPDVFQGLELRLPAVTRRLDSLRPSAIALSNRVLHAVAGQVLSRLPSNLSEGSVLAWVELARGTPQLRPFVVKYVYDPAIGGPLGFPYAYAYARWDDGSPASAVFALRATVVLASALCDPAEWASHTGQMARSHIELCHLLETAVRSAVARRSPWPWEQVLLEAQRVFKFIVWTCTATRPAPAGWAKLTVGAWCYALAPFDLLLVLLGVMCETTVKAAVAVAAAAATKPADVPPLVALLVDRPTLFPPTTHFHLARAIANTHPASPAPT
jgi:hypothetical protein